MSKVSDHYGSSYIKTEDLTKSGIIVEIAAVNEEEVGNTSKLVAYFNGTDLGFPLNKTNAEEIAETLGDETDGWSGKRLRLFKTNTQFNGKRTACARVEVSENAVTEQLPF